MSRIEADAGPIGITVKSPDRIQCRSTGRLREVDASVRTRVGTTDVLVTIECRRRGQRQDVTWIEQLATKRQSLGAARTIAVSSSGFSGEARVIAYQLGIELRDVEELTAAELNSMLKLDFVYFNHKVCSIARVGLRLSADRAWQMTDVTAVDAVLPYDTDPLRPIFKSEDTGRCWSLNNMWHELQGTTDPFEGVERGNRPIIKTACFTYPGNVLAMTPSGEVRLGDVLLSMALSVEIEKISLDKATRVKYSAERGPSLQRVEFESEKPGAENFRVSLQAPADSGDFAELRTRFDWL